MATNTKRTNTKRYISAIIIQGAVSILFARCASPPVEDYVSPSALGPLYLEQINQIIDNDDYRQAIQNIDRYRRSTDISNLQRVERLYDQSVQGIITQFEEAISQEEYRDAIRHYATLETLNQTEKIVDWSLDLLYLSWADQMLDQGAITNALRLFLKVAHIAQMDQEVIQRYIDIAREQQDGQFLQIISAVLDDSISGITDELPSIDNITPNEQLEGTATVVVDRGIKIENGLGSVDIVYGSGFFIDKRGYLLTNHHVISSEVDPEYEGYSRLYIILQSDPNVRVPAKVVGFDQLFDLALLKVEIEPKYVFNFSTQHIYQPGSAVFAFGSPGGLGNTLTSGIISASNRRFFQMGEALQIDAPINPGNSGGALVNDEGEVIGVIFAGIEQFEGINFAIPSYWIEKVLLSLYTDREVEHPWIGVALREQEGNLEVIYVFPFSPAYEIGVVTGDILVSIQGARISTIVEAQDMLLDLGADRLTTITLEREGEEISALVDIRTRPFSPIEESLNVDSRERLFAPLFGMEVESLSQLLLYPNYRTTRIYPGSIASNIGLEVGDQFSVVNWRVNLETRVVIMQISARKRTRGFVGSAITIGSLLENNNYL